MRKTCDELISDEWVELEDRKLVHGTDEIRILEVVELETGTDAF